MSTADAEKHEEEGANERPLDAANPLADGIPFGTKLSQLAFSAATTPP